MTFVSVYGQMTALPSQTRKCRRAAAKLRLTAALTDRPEMRFAMYKIAEGYERMAHSAEKRCGAHLNKGHLPLLGPSHCHNSPLLAHWRRPLDRLSDPHPSLPQP